MSLSLVSTIVLPSVLQMLSIPSVKVADAATGAAGYTPITIFILAPGAFLVLAGLAAIQNKVKINMAKKGKDVSKIQSGCGSNCATCGGCPSDKE